MLQLECADKVFAGFSGLMTMWVRATHKLPRAQAVVINCGWLSQHCQRGTKSSRNQSQHVLSSLENF